MAGVFGIGRKSLRKPGRSFGADAERLRRDGDAAGAAKLCRAGLEAYPDQVSARVTLGLALLDLGKLDEARAELESAYQSAPDNLAAIRALAELHAKAEDAMMASVEQDTDWAATLADAAATEALIAKAAEAAAEAATDAEAPAPDEAFDLNDEAVDRIVAAVEASDESRVAPFPDQPPESGPADAPEQPAPVEFSESELAALAETQRDMAAAEAFRPVVESDPPEAADIAVVELEAVEDLEQAMTDLVAADEATLRQVAETTEPEDEPGPQAAGRDETELARDAEEFEAARAQASAFTLAQSDLSRDAESADPDEPVIDLDAADDAWQLADLMDDAQPVQPLVSGSPAADDDDADAAAREDADIESSVEALRRFLRQAEERRNEVDGE